MSSNLALFRTRRFTDQSRRPATTMLALPWEQQAPSSEQDDRGGAGHGAGAASDLLQLGRLGTPYLRAVRSECRMPNLRKPRDDEWVDGMSPGNRALAAVRSRCAAAMENSASVLQSTYAVHVKGAIAEKAPRPRVVRATPDKPQAQPSRSRSEPLLHERSDPSRVEEGVRWSPPEPKVVGVDAVPHRVRLSSPEGASRRERRGAGLLSTGPGASRASRGAAPPRTPATPSWEASYGADADAACALSGKGLDTVDAGGVSDGPSGGAPPPVGAQGRRFEKAPPPVGAQGRRFEKAPPPVGAQGRRSKVSVPVPAPSLPSQHLPSPYVAHLPRLPAASHAKPPPKARKVAAPPPIPLPASTAKRRAGEALRSAAPPWWDMPPPVSRLAEAYDDHTAELRDETAAALHELQRRAGDYDGLRRAAFRQSLSQLRAQRFRVQPLRMDSAKGGRQPRTRRPAAHRRLELAGGEAGGPWRGVEHAVLESEPPPTESPPAATHPTERPRSPWSLAKSIWAPRYDAYANSTLYLAAQALTKPTPHASPRPMLPAIPRQAHAPRSLPSLAKHVLPALCVGPHFDRP